MAALNEATAKKIIVLAGAFMFWGSWGLTAAGGAISRTSLEISLQEKIAGASKKFATALHTQTARTE